MNVIFILKSLKFQSFSRHLFTTVRGQKPVNTAFVCARLDHHWAGNELLENNDPEMYALIRKEKERQRNGLELIASEVRCLD